MAHGVVAIDRGHPCKLAAYFFDYLEASDDAMRFVSSEGSRDDGECSSVFCRRREYVVRSPREGKVCNETEQGGQAGGSGSSCAPGAFHPKTLSWTTRTTIHCELVLSVLC